MGTRCLRMSIAFFSMVARASSASRAGSSMGRASSGFALGSGADFRVFSFTECAGYRATLGKWSRRRCSVVIPSSNALSPRDTTAVGVGLERGGRCRCPSRTARGGQHGARTGALCGMTIESQVRCSSGGSRTRKTTTLTALSTSSRRERGGSSSAAGRDVDFSARRRPRRRAAANELRASRV